jgi:hypothetical protein
MAIKHKVSMTGYPLSYYKDDKWLYLIACGLMFGENSKEMIKDMRKQSECVKVEEKNDFVVVVIKQPLFTEPVYDSRIIRPSPVVINWKQRKHNWELASFDKGLLTNVYEFAKKYLGAKMLKIKQEKLSNISIVQLLPKITLRQKRALELAINNGYYDYPRKIELEKLAKMMNVSYSTYQEHLRKAEGLMMPAAYKEL